MFTSQNNCDTYLLHIWGKTTEKKIGNKIIYDMNRMHQVNKFMKINETLVNNSYVYLNIYF